MGEIDKLLAKAATKGHLEALESYYNEHATPEVKAIAKAGKKTIKGAYAYITSYAKTKAKDGCAMLTDDTEQSCNAARRATRTPVRSFGRSPGRSAAKSSELTRPLN